MQDWYYHAPGQGRIGPISAEKIRQHYRERRIDRETLVWREGMREWRPIDQLIDALGLIGVEPDTSLPPPMPAKVPSLSVAETVSSPHGPPMTARTTSASPPKSRVSGCLITAIVVGIVGVMLVAILAAIALPAYNDYVKRAKAQQSGAAVTAEFDAQRMSEYDAHVRRRLDQAMRADYPKEQICPDEFEFESLEVREPTDFGMFAFQQIKPKTGQCAYQIGFQQFGPDVDGKHAVYEVSLNNNEVVVTCSSAELAAAFKPPGCG